ncbi:MAG: hypothetical protein AAFN63_08890 [Pseudomonadota bacterium]
MDAQFNGGPNIAMKVPPHQHEATVAFYRDTLKLKELHGNGDKTVGFQFGANRLWIDKVDTVSQAELWLQVVTNNTSDASTRLKEAGAPRCDEIEPLGESFDGFWISNPAGVIHLIDGQ